MPLDKILQQGTSFVIVDIWHAIFTTSKCFILYGGILAIGGGILISIFLGAYLPNSWPAIWTILSLLLASPFTLKVWQAQSAGIEINPIASTLTLSADDLENSLQEILTLQRFFSHANRISISVSDIERLDNDTLKVGIGKFKRKGFGLNISGSFGSYQLMFSHKQKRDECRNRLIQTIRSVRGDTPSHDTNIAFPY